MEEVKANVTMPFQVNADANGNVVPLEQPKRKGRPRKPISGETFIIISDGAASVCSKEDIVSIASKVEAPEIYLVGKKVKSVVVTQAKIDVLSNKKLTEDSLEIVYE